MIGINSILSGDNKALARIVTQPVGNDPERIMPWTQVIAGLQADDLTAVRVLDAAAWHERRARLEKLGGPPVSD